MKAEGTRQPLCSRRHRMVSATPSSGDEGAEDSNSNASSRRSTRTYAYIGTYVHITKYRPGTTSRREKAFEGCDGVASVTRLPRTALASRESSKHARPLLWGRNPVFAGSRAVRCNLATGHVATLSFQFPGPSASYCRTARPLPYELGISTKSQRPRCWRLATVVFRHKCSVVRRRGVHRPRLGAVGQSGWKHTRADPSEAGVMLKLKHQTRTRHQNSLRLRVFIIFKQIEQDT